MVISSVYLIYAVATLCLAEMCESRKAQLVVVVVQGHVHGECVSIYIYIFIYITLE